MKFPLQCFSKIITGTTGLLAAPDSGQDGVGGRDSWASRMRASRLCWAWVLRILSK
ncbi:hypothetical protein HanPSC8_Chr05g0201761 [Helianthus annuus]|nr:hypothetical protein HanPSC8_Chr05g0201761 [Helianthus annuus]